MMGRTRHADKIIEVTQSSSAAARSQVAASWHRSALKYGLDPDETRAPERVEQADLENRRAALERFMIVASPRLDTLFSLVGQSGCAVLLTDAEGIVLDQRMSDGDTSAFEAWGLAAGSNWSEAHQGTNGIGTCLTENRRVIVDRDEHFFARNTGMSCIDAPIYGADGSLVAALDVSRAARSIFGLQRTGTISARPAADILGREDGPTGFQKAERAAVVRALARADGNVSQAARQLGVGRATLYRRMKRLGLNES